MNALDQLQLTCRRGQWDPSSFSEQQRKALPQSTISATQCTGVVQDIGMSVVGSLSGTCTYAVQHLPLRHYGHCTEVSCLGLCLFQL